MKTTTQFLNQFKLLEKRLKTLSGLIGDNVRFSSLIKQSKLRNPVIEYKEGLIWDLYGLRNIFAHSDREKYIASINELAFDTLNEIIDLIDNPPTVGEVFSCDVFTASTDDITETVLKTMQSKLFTHIPVYDGDNFIQRIKS